MPYAPGVDGHDERRQYDHARAQRLADLEREREARERQRQSVAKGRDIETHRRAAETHRRAADLHDEAAIVHEERVEETKDDA
jgi:hypothetical protein